jgi:hypothetical protein
MHWYNPKAREGEDVGPPTTDVEAYEMLRGDLNSGAFMAEYERLRAGEGMEIEQAMILVGHEFRMRHLRYQPVGTSRATNSSAEGRRPRPLGAARGRHAPSSSGYKLPLCMGLLSQRGKLAILTTLKKGAGRDSDGKQKSEKSADLSGLIRSHSWLPK